MPEDMIRFDASDFTAMARRLREAADMYERDLTPTLARAAVMVETSAKEIAAGSSQSIPPTIHSDVLPGAAVVAAGGPGEPLAQLFELGNKGARRSAKTFRHPVFGNRDVWVEQAKHPFLKPALARQRRAITGMLLAQAARSFKIVGRDA